MGLPHPEEELQRLQKLVAKGLPPLLLLTGVSDFFRTAAAELALAAVPKDAELRLVDAVGERGGGGGGGGGGEDGGEGGGDADAGEDEAQAAGPAADGDDVPACAELQDLRGGGLFAKRTVVVVRRGGNWWKRYGAAVAAQLPKFQKGCSLVVEAPKLDKRKKVVQTLLKNVASEGGLVEFRDLYELPFERSRGPLDGELVKWVVRRAQKLGLPLQPEAAWLLVAQVGKQPAELLAEVQRLAAALAAAGKGAAKAPLGPDDLRGKVTCSFESTPFEFAEAVLGLDRRRALRSVRAMFDRGVRSKDGKPMDPGGVFPFTTSWLFASLAQAYEGRGLLDDGVPARDVAARVGVRQYEDRFAAQLQRLDRARLRRGLLALHHCQRALRLTGEAPEALLERFLSQWFDGAPVPTAEELEL